jgi:hypothetical protein
MGITPCWVLTLPEGYEVLVRVVVHLTGRFGKQIHFSLLFEKRPAKGINKVPIEEDRYLYVF